MFNFAFLFLFLFFKFYVLLICRVVIVMRAILCFVVLFSWRGQWQIWDFNVTCISHSDGPYW